MIEERNIQQPVNADWWDILSAVIYFFAMMTVATRLVTTNWVYDLDLVQTVAFLGIFTGLALGKSVFSRGIIFLFSLAYGFFVVPWQLGLTLGIGIEWQERILIMIERLRSIFLALILREDVTDNLFFLLLMAILFWILSVYSSYQLVRNGDVWRAALPGGLAIFVIHNYDPILVRRTWYLAFYIFLFLILLARNYYIRQERRWKSVRTYVPPDAGFDFVRFTLLVSIVIVLMAWNSPALADTISPISNIYHAIERPWVNAKERMGYMFASLRATVGLVTDYYAEVQPLGRGNVNSDTPVMRILAPRVDYPGLRFYWRARVYDQYNDGTWTTSVEDVLDFNPENEDLLISDGGERQTVEVEITPRSALITLYSPSQPIWFSRSASIHYFTAEDGALDFVTAKASPFVRPADVYTVRASLPTVTEAELRETGTEYPQWVADRFLQLPESITPRTKLLAQRLAEGKETPYDIAQTITIWLRDNIEYVELIDAPPRGQEPIDWFLFDYRKGFCNYYSSSMIVMLRSLGIPARWAVGYAQGNPISNPGPILPDELRGQVPELFFEDEIVYSVRQIDAHAWPEVYFPGVGWIEFEPTVSQNALFRPSGIDLFENNLGNPVGGNTDRSQDLPMLDDLMNLDEGPTQQNQGIDPFRVIIISVISGIVGVAIIITVIFYYRNPVRFKTWWDEIRVNLKTPLSVQIEFSLNRFGFHPPDFILRLAYQAKLPLAAKSFLEVNKANQRLGLLINPNFTPYERVVTLSRRIPDLTETAHGLLQEYHNETYGTLEPNEYIINFAGNRIRQLSTQIWIDSVLRKLKHPFSKREKS